MLTANATRRRVLSVTEGRDAKTINEPAAHLDDHGCPQAPPNARITFDKFRVVMHVNPAVDEMRRIEQRNGKSLKGMRRSLLKDRAKLKPAAAGDLDALIARMTTVRLARA